MAWEADFTVSLLLMYRAVFWDFFSQIMHIAYTVPCNCSNGLVHSLLAWLTLGWTVVEGKMKMLRLPFMLLHIYITVRGKM